MKKNLTGPGSLEQITKQDHSSLPEDLYLGMSELLTHPLKEVLTKLELEEYQSFRNSRRREEYLSARYLIRELASEAGFNPDRFEIKKDTLGKPFAIHGKTRCNLSLAHADRKVICGLSDSVQIGIDLEPSHRKVSGRLRSRILHEQEIEPLSGEELVRIWTLKEAMVKLDGRGIRTNLDQIVLSPVNDSEFLGKFDNGEVASVVSFEYDGYWIAVAYYTQQK